MTNLKESKNLRAQALIVDDDPIIRLALKSFLETQGCTVDEAENGVKALEVFDHRVHDFILLDTVMPGMDGFQVCDKIRKSTHGHNIPIVMITVMSDEASIEKGFRMGASDYVPKPFNWGLLFYRVKNLIEKKRVEDQQKKLQQQLQHAKKIEAIGQASGGIAHVFNNLLTTILGYTSLSLEKYASKTDSSLVEYLTEVKTAGLRAHELVKKMLTYSQDDMGVPIVLSPPAIIAEIVTNRKDKESSAIELQTDFDSTLDCISIDSNFLTQILERLIDNAAESINATGVIRLGARNRPNFAFHCDSCHRDQKGDYVEIFVEDNGSAIESGIVERIFDPFFTTKEMAEGMGLSVVHGIVHANKGHILVESDRNKGTLIRLLFPATSQG